MGTRAILIYGCGYVGKAAAAHWKSKGYRVAALTRGSSNLENHVDAIHPIDTLDEVLINYDTLLLAVGGEQLHHARRLAHTTAVSQLRTLIYTSSLSVYGDQQGRLVDEETPLAPSPLLEAEEQLEGLRSSSLQVCILRLGQIIGPGRTLVEMVKRHPAPWPGDGSAIVHLSPLETIIAGIAFALEQQLDGTYNLCRGGTTTRRELYMRLCQEEGLPPPSWDATLPQRHGGNRIVSSEKIVRAGFRF